MIKQQSNKMRIARQFGRKAQGYDAAAQVQLDIAFDALSLLPPTSGRVLDIGCGTGRISRQLALTSDQVIGLDIALGMLNYAKQQHGDSAHWLLADAESLPLQDNSMDRIFSSMALQWCEGPQVMFRELFRVLRPGGKGVLAIPCYGSLAQLQHCWQQLDGQRHTNQFISSDVYQSMAGKAGFNLQAHTRHYQSWHADVRAVLASIKEVGANVLTETAQRTRLDRQSLARLQQLYYRQFQVKGQLPLSYQLCFLQLEKPL